MGSIASEWAANKFHAVRSSDGGVGAGSDCSPAPQRDCEDCGAAIATNRLRAVPDATRCVSCQSFVDEPLVASRVIGTEEEFNAADFAIVRARHRVEDETYGN